MDTGEGRFEKGNNLEELYARLINYDNPGGIFSVGERVTIKGSLFKIQKITPKKMVLKLMKKPAQTQTTDNP